MSEAFLGVFLGASWGLLDLLQCRVVKVVFLAVFFGVGAIGHSF